MPYQVLQPLAIRSMTLKNRILMPPMGTRKAEADGKAGPAILAHYNEKSAGGYLSLVIVEHSFVEIRGKASAGQLSVAEDAMIPCLAALAKTIQDNGCKAMVQINHAGSIADTAASGHPLVAPSAIPNPRKDAGVPKELTKEEIAGIVAAFAAAAVRVQKAGFDGVEIHSAHGYLLNQFFSPLSNKRTDVYGGNVENRIRIHLEILRAVRKAVGNDFPVFIRLGASDYMEGGITIEDSVLAAKAFEQAGADAIDISGGFCMYTIPDTAPGFFAPLSTPIKQSVRIPVVLTGGVKELSSAEALLKEGKGDLIGVGRAILSDSAWAKNAFETLK
jgi:NADPH2 dehydrogenase